MGADPALVKHWRRVTDQQVAVAVQATVAVRSTPLAATDKA